MAKEARWQTKPIERRALYTPANHLPQGVLECYLDILPPEIATAFPPDKVALPPNRLFEVRVVIWKTKEVPAMDPLEGQFLFVEM